MKVILLKEVKKLGKAGEIVEVKNGYGKNYLIKNGLAKIASASALKQREQILASQKAKLEKLKAKAKEIIEKLKKETFAFKKKKTPKGETFGSVSPKDIAKEIETKYPESADLELEIKSDHIKSFGDFEIEITFLKTEKGKIKISVNEEK